tara:strand:- start:1044 stop:2636 length:1593 start_codon:yes stop_codon:yes gene_type:complete
MKIPWKGAKSVFAKVLARGLYKPFQGKKREKYSKLMDFTSQQYLEFLGGIIAHENKIKGNLSHVSYKEKETGGISIARGGHFGEVTFHYSNGESHEVFLKTEKENPIFRKRFQHILAKEFDFIPKRYDVSDYQFQDTLDKDVPFLKKFRSTRKVYDRIEGPTISEDIEEKGLDEIVKSGVVDTLFSNMKEIYDTPLTDAPITKELLEEGLDPLHDAFYIQVANKIQNSPEGKDFLNTYHPMRFTSLEKTPRVLIHSDLHPDNAYSTGKVIDWEGLQLGVPYQDFFFFSVLSNLEQSSSYAAEKEKFLKKNAEASPINSQSQSHIEFETYLRLLKRFDKTKSQIKDGEHKATLDDACGYLLKKCYSSLQSLEEQTQTNDLVKKFDAYVKSEDSLQEIVSHNVPEKVDIYQAHKINHLFGTGSSELKSRNNVENDTFVEGTLNMVRGACFGSFAAMLISAVAVGGSLYEMASQVLGPMPIETGLFALFTAGAARSLYRGTKQNERKNAKILKNLDRYHNLEAGTKQHYSHTE